jgi:hypothetical protein
MTRKTRRRVALAGLGLFATLFQFFPSGCAQYYAYGGVNAFDFCAILNCTSSTYFDLCEPIVLLVDCPNLGGANP